MKIRQKFVDRTVVNGIVQIDGQHFKPSKPVLSGTRHKFIVFYDDRGVRSPVYSYVRRLPFLKWNEDKKKRCSLGAEES